VYEECRKVPRFFKEKEERMKQTTLYIYRGKERIQVEEERRTLRDGQVR
jgi:hypothetical protein